MNHSLKNKTMKSYTIVSLVAFIIILASCKKENTTNNNTAAIQGTYKLKYLTSKTNSTAIGTGGEKVVTTSEYTTINNQGIIVFDNSNLTATNLTYSVQTVASSYLYQDNDLIDSLSYPFTFTLPESNSEAAYKLIGADSIYFPQGSLTSGVGSTGSTQLNASGGRYSFNGNLLTITQIASKDSTFENSGITFHLNESAVSSVVMEKQ